MRVSRKWCSARARERRKHAVSMFRRAINMEITVEDSKRCNIAQSVRGWTQSVGGESRRRNAFDSTMFSKSVCVEPLYMRLVLHKGADKASVWSQ